MLMLRGEAEILARMLEDRGLQPQKKKADAKLLATCGRLIQLPFFFQIDLLDNKMFKLKQEK